MKNRQNRSMESLSLALAILVSLFGLWMFLLQGPSYSFGQQEINDTYFVNTTVNITNSAPTISAIALDTPVNLIAYDNQTVFCNVSTYDYDNDTLNVKAILFLNQTVASDAPDDGNNHYTNWSCQPTSIQGEAMNWTCSFGVRFYADNSSNWVCNATVSDSGLVNTSNTSNYAQINPLVAIKMDDLLDYGDLEVGMTSNNTEANITNAGNRPLNISVKGWGATEGDGFSFVCDYGQIDLSYERYTPDNSTPFATMTEITGSDVQIENFLVPQRTNETHDQINTTYWRVYIPVGAGGVCNGKLQFTAEDWYAGG